jgi:predicted SnoaL-like aldol condensation-catalyzing enzyme
MMKIYAGLVVVLLLFTGYESVFRKKTTDCEKEAQTMAAHKKLVADLYQELFGDKNTEAINKYIGDEYIQHNPNVADGKQALLEATRNWFKNAPKEKIDIQHIGADGDLVFIHLKSHMGSKTFSVIDIFRIKDNKITEHWDVMQEVPAKAANNHPMF